MSQIQRVLSKLKNEGQVSRNFYINLQYDKITRLGAHIRVLRNQGYAIETKETDNDTLYILKATPSGEKPVKVEYQEVIRNGERVMVRREVPIQSTF